MPRGANTLSAKMSTRTMVLTELATTDFLI